MQESKSPSLKVSSGEEVLQQSTVESEDTYLDRSEESSEDVLSTDSNELVSSTDEAEPAVVLTAEDRQIVRDVVDGLIRSTIQTVLLQFQQGAMNNEPIQQETLSSESGLTSPITVLAVEDRSESSLGTVHTDTATLSDDRDHYDLETQTSEMTNVTWTDLVGDSSSVEPLVAVSLDGSTATLPENQSQTTGISGSSTQV